MLVILINLCSIGVLIIGARTGNFNYENYHELHHVVEGTLEDYQYDSLTVRVTKVWSGQAEVGDNLTFFHQYDVGMELNQLGLFIADSSSNLSIHGLLRDGYFIMVGRSSPNILTEDDLEALSSGELPEFNNHKSKIAVHFPLTTEVINLTVHFRDGKRVTETDFIDWDNRRVHGTLLNGSERITEFGMHLPGNEVLNHPLLLSGEVRKYSGGIYYLDLWPKYPAFASIESYFEFIETGHVPIYAFKIELQNSDPWSIGLPEHAYLISDGSDFYMTGRQRIVSRPYYLKDSDSFDMPFPLFTSGGRASTRSTLLRLEDLSTTPRKPLLMTILSQLQDSNFDASLYFIESDDSEPVLYSGCTIGHSDLRYRMETDVASLDSIGLDGSMLKFTVTGSALLEFNRSNYDQIHTESDIFGDNIRGHNSALFNHPYDETKALLLHFSSISSYTNHADLSDFLIAQLIEHSILSDTIEGIAYEVNLSNYELQEITTFILNEL